MTRNLGPLIGFFGVAVLTTALLSLRSRLNIATVALLLLLPVFACAIRFGRVAAFVSAVSAAVSLNFFFIPPFYTLSIGSSQNVAVFGVFIGTGFIVAELSSRAREQAEQAQQQRTQAEHLYAELARTIEEKSAAEAQVQSQKLKSAFLDAVTHDLRTPLTSIKAAASGLLAEKAEAPDRLRNQRVREMLAVIVEESDRLNRFIENIIDLARRRSGQGLSSEPASIGEIVEASLDRAGGRLAERRVETNIPDDLPRIFADRSAIAEVLYNLLDNAAKYSGMYSRIDVIARHVGNEIQVTVEDEGQGIRAELRTQVFEKFARAADGQAGSGMGLAIAKSIIDAHDGRIWIDGRRTGRGSAITFALPVKVVHAETSSQYES